MNILVIGCGQVGAALVRDLERIGHDISLIEKDPEQIKRLDSFDDYSFGGTALIGDPTDPDVICRVSDPHLQVLYHKAFELDTVCPTILTEQAVFRALSK